MFSGSDAEAGLNDSYQHIFQGVEANRSVAVVLAKRGPHTRCVIAHGVSCACAGDVELRSGEYKNRMLEIT